MRKIIIILIIAYSFIEFITILLWTKQYTNCIVSGIQIKFPNKIKLGLYKTVESCYRFDIPSTLKKWNEQSVKRWSGNGYVKNECRGWQETDNVYYVLKEFWTQNIFINRMSSKRIKTCCTTFGSLYTCNIEWVSYFDGNSIIITAIFNNHIQDS